MIPVLSLPAAIDVFDRDLQVVADIGASPHAPERSCTPARDTARRSERMSLPGPWAEPQGGTSMRLYFDGPTVEMPSSA